MREIIGKVLGFESFGKEAYLRVESGDVEELVLVRAAELGGRTLGECAHVRATRSGDFVQIAGDEIETRRGRALLANRFERLGARQ